VVKAQIHAGGRGKGGGVKLAQSIDEAKSLADEIVGMTLVTHQTGPEGRLVKKVLVEQGLDIKKELYLSVIPDRETAKIVIMASEAGGMDIEEVAEKTPEKIIKVFINPLTGSLYRLFVTYDCSLLEINPLVITMQETVIALDAKINFDDSALFRHKDIVEYRDLDEEDPFEVEAYGYHQACRCRACKLSGCRGRSQR